MNYPDVCTAQPQHGKAFCLAHCRFIESSHPEVPTDLRGFLQYCGVLRNTQLSAGITHSIISSAIFHLGEGNAKILVFLWEGKFQLFVKLISTLSIYFFMTHSQLFLIGDLTDQEAVDLKLIIVLLSGTLAQIKSGLYFTFFLIFSR